MLGAAAGRQAVFLDRDGVLNRSDVVDGKPYAPRSLDAFRLLPGVVKAVSAIRQAGALIIVVTNQPDIGNGFVSREVVDAMHGRLNDRLAPDRIMCCPHAQSDGCLCRKPRPGMLLDAAKALDIDLSRSVMVGDRRSDIEAGRAVGCRTVFIDRGYREAKPSVSDGAAANLPAAVGTICALLRDA